VLALATGPPGRSRMRPPTGAPRGACLPAAGASAAPRVRPCHLHVAAVGTATRQLSAEKAGLLRARLSLLEGNRTCTGPTSGLPHGSGSSLVPAYPASATLPGWIWGACKHVHTHLMARPLLRTRKDLVMAQPQRIGANRHTYDVLVSIPLALMLLAPVFDRVWVILLAGAASLVILLFATILGVRARPSRALGNPVFPTFTRGDLSAGRTGFRLSASRLSPRCSRGARTWRLLWHIRRNSVLLGTGVLPVEYARYTGAGSGK